MTDLRWVIQENLFNETEFDNFCAAIGKSGASYSVVKVIPFSHELTPDPPEGPKVVYGSTALSRIAQERGWLPGAFLNENFDHREWVKHWDDRVLNHAAE